MRKRQRAHMTLMTEIDNLNVAKPVYDSSSDSDGQDDAPPHSTPVGVSSSYSLSESFVSVDSLGTTEIELLHRKDEQLSDMALFLSSTLKQVASTESLQELVTFFATRDWREIVKSMKHSGVLGKFFLNLFSAKLNEANTNCLLLFVSLLQTECSTDVLSNPIITRCMLATISGTVKRESTMETPKKVHWASKKKKVEKVASEGGDGILKGLQRMGCKVQLKSSVAIAVDCLFQLIFAQNQSSVNLPPEVNACHQLVAHNGLRILAEKIQHPSPLRKELLLLLEVVTLGSTDLSTASGFDETVSTVTHVLLQQGDSGEHYTLLLRIVTNLSNLKPVAFSEEAESIAHHFKNVLLYTEDAEKLTFVLCCAVNLCKYDLYAGACRFAKYLCAQEVLSTLCTKMYHFYNSDDINLIVLSGYCALFLGTVSLFSEKEFDLRIQVITALAKVTKDTEMGTKVAHQPMKLIVAILQEFILFQSTSGTLTKSSLVEMSDLIDRIVKQNKISIDSE